MRKRLMKKRWKSFCDSFMDPKQQKSDGLGEHLYRFCVSFAQELNVPPEILVPYLSKGPILSDTSDLYTNIHTHGIVKRFVTNVWDEVDLHEQL